VPLPDLAFTASKNVVLPGEEVRLQWQSRSATACAASGDWSGTRAPSGSQMVGPLQSDQVFALSCHGRGGTRLREVLVQVRNADGAVVELEVSQPAVRVGGQAHLTWTSRNVDKCQSSGGWAGEKPRHGEFTTSGLQHDTTFRLTCRGKGGRAVALVTVAVSDGRLRWQAPVENEDGTPLTDLSGFVLYWGAESGHYTGSAKLGRKTREWLADLASGSYYFAITAVDSDGDESGYSNELEKFIP